MRLHLCGSSGTGKSTLAKVLGEKLNIPVINNVVRKVPVEQRLSYLGQCAVFMEALTTYTASDNYVADRYYYDIIAYSMLTKSWDDKMVGSMLNMLNNPQFVPDLLIYTPIEFPMEADKERVVNESQRKTCDVIINAFIRKFYKGKLLIVTGSVEARTNQVLGKLGITCYT